jgi:dihydroxyacetone kinase
MAYVFNSERSFKDDAINGLAAAYSRWLRRVPGAAALASVAAPQKGRVSTIVGGGSGHFPAFAGLVGPGLADGATCGDIFASPSAEQARRTIRAVDADAGVLMMFGNYAGDVMHFGLAAGQVGEQDGIDARIVLVTDDVASAKAGDEGNRRGIAGGFFVFRAAAAAAWHGDSLDEVERVARHANERTRTIGVGFDGCTLPGANEPLFTVEAGRMEVGLGIHGESGIETVDRLGADELAELLVVRLLDERPDEAKDARILVNGLGRVKYEELFALYGPIARRLGDAGVRLTEPEVGEFVTSLDMAGCSLTLVWTDEELEALLSTPAQSPGYTRAGELDWDGQTRELARSPGADDDKPDYDEADLDETGKTARRAIEAIAARISELEKRLGELDAVAGDGDHGMTMARGIDGAIDAARCAGPDAPAVLDAAGMGFADAAGGAAGALWGIGLTTIGIKLGEDGGDEDNARRLASALEAAQDAVLRLGASKKGDKTLIDVLDPFVSTLSSAARKGKSTRDAWAEAAEVAEQAARDTADMTPRKGRAARQADRSKGTEDPGSVSLAASLTAVGDVLR